MKLDSLQLQLCDIQGRLFERSLSEGIDSAAFVRAFMEGPTAAGYDRTFDRAQWMGEGYLLDEVDEEAGGLPRTGASLDGEALYWMGYTYRYWHFLTGESSKDIYVQADAATMNGVYPAYHTLSCEMAVERLKEMAHPL